MCECEWAEWGETVAAEHLSLPQDRQRGSLG